MKRKLALITLAFYCLGLFTACGGQTASSLPPPVPEAPKQHHPTGRTYL